MTRRIRIWSPFVIAYVGGLVTVINEATIGDYLGVYNPLLGYAAVEVYGGALLGVVAALVSRMWRGLLTFVLGLLAVGETVVILGVLNGGHVDLGDVVAYPVIGALFLGFFGVPIYVIITGIASVLRWVFVRIADRPG